VWTKKAEETKNFFITQEETNATETISASNLLADIGLSTETSGSILLDEDKRKKLEEKWKLVAANPQDIRPAFKEALEVAGNLVGDLQQAYLDKLLDEKTLLSKEQLKTLKEFADNFSAVMKLQMFGGGRVCAQAFHPDFGQAAGEQGQRAGAQARGAAGARNCRRRIATRSCRSISASGEKPRRVRGRRVCDN